MRPPRRGPNEVVTRESPTARTISPDTMSTACQIRTSRTLTRTCASSGFVSAKSSFPSRTSSMRRVMFGWMYILIAPPMRICTPRTQRSSDFVHPFSSSVCE